MKLADLEDVYELTPMQQGMMFHTLLEPETSQYFEQYVCDLRGPLDLTAFRRAWADIIRANAIFRTSFLTDGEGKPVQVVHREAQMPLEVGDWSAAPPADWKSLEEDFVRADRARGFDLAKPPLMRAAIFRLGEDRHRLVWSRHHLLLDAWSRVMVFEDVFSAYEAFRVGREFSPRERRPYGDYIAWLQDQDAGKARDYWTGVFHGFEGGAPLEIGPAPEAFEHLPDVYRQQSVTVGAETTSRLRRLARERGLTFNTLVQGAWAVLLARYGDRDDVVFGATVSGRPPALAGVESMIGLFVNTLPVRVRVDPAAPVSGWLRNLQAEQSELREYEYSALVDVQKWSGIGPGRALFDTLLVFENAPKTDAAPAGPSTLRVEESRNYGSRTNYPLSLLVDAGTELLILAVSDSRLYGSCAVGRLLAHLATLLESIADEPDAAVGALPLLTPQEEHRLLVEWNATAEDYPRDASVTGLLEIEARAHPGRVALSFEGGSRSYGELNARANRLARVLAARGVSRGDLVGVCVPRSAEMVCAVIAVLKSGAAYVPLDPTYPADRLAYILRDSRARIAIVDDTSRGRLPAAEVALVSLDADRSEIERQASDDLGTTVSAGDRMYVAYTSGSTGQPKGVEATHRASINRFSWMWKRYPFAPGEMSCLSTTLSFVDSVWQIFGPLLQGVPVRVLSDETVRDPQLLVEELERSEVTRIVLVPSLLRAILDTVGTSSGRLPRLVQCVSSGEPLPVDAAALCLERLPGTRLINLYGSSEVAADVTFYEVTEARGASIPIGRPIANTRIYLFDSHRNPVPVGVAGGLFVGGDGVALGYLGRPDLTRERFLPDPFSKEPSARLYRTGDLARYREDGIIEYLGRSDQQVKIRGHRVEPGEVEAALGAHPDVREAVVAARPDAAGQRLVAWMRFGERAATPAQLREFLGSRLPEYMMPSLFVTVTSFPLTPNGKVDRRALPEPAAPASSADSAPRSGVEEVLALIWSEVLELPRVGVHDDVFELGAHSLLATRALSRIRDAFTIELPLRALFEAPTIAGLAERVESARRAAGGVATPPLHRAEPADRYPLSFPQQRLWFVQELQPDASHYNVQRAIRMRGPLAVSVLEKTLTEIERRHEALRTNFVAMDGEPFQVIRASSAFALDSESLESAPVSDRSDAFVEIARREAKRPFDLSRGPVLRGLLVRFAEDDHILVLTLHHIVCDAWSLGVLSRELALTYEAFAAGESSPLPELPIQYRDYAVWQREVLSGETLEKLLSYWRERLGNDRSVLDLRTDRPRPPVQTSGGARVSRVLPAGLSRRLEAIGREEGATLFMVLLAAFQALLGRETGQTSVAVGTDVANRTRVETENLIGFFVNLLVLRTDLSGNPKFRELLARVRETALGAYSHQDLPFERLVEELKPERDLSRNPLVQVLFVMQNVPGAGKARTALEWSGVDVGTDVARFDLAVFVNATDDGYLANWVYNTALFDAETLRRLAERFERLLESIAADPDARLEDLEMISESEKQRLDEAKSARRDVQSSRLKSMRRKAVDLTSAGSMRIGPLQEEQLLPLVIQPGEEAVDLPEWAKAERPFIEEKLLKHGAILFRGFGVKSPDEFERFASSLCPQLFGEYGDLPREAVGGKVYGSTPYPSDEAILFHNESSHMHRWPMKIWFYCVLPAREGGDTPIVDCRAVYRALDPSLARRFEEKGLMYVRNYGEGLDVSWQSFYGTTDPAVVEEMCRQSGTDFEWRDGGALRTRQRCPAIVRHPQTGELSFFNQVQLHHVSFLKPEVRESLASLMKQEDLPRNVYYGDGTPIEDSVMAEVGEIYRRTSVSFPWQAGDVLMLNNMLVAHSRNPYVGPRKIVVAMAEMFEQKELVR